MMKQFILASFLICCAAITVRAQKVYTQDDNGRTMYVIECEGMPTGSYTKNPKPSTTNGTNSTKGTNTADNLGSEINNKMVGYKFEVAATDNSTGSNWLTAVNLCAGLSGGSWRLPTQRELQLIWIQHEKLKSLSGFTSFSANYWSSTENSGSTSWFLDFNSGYTFYNNDKIYDYGVRCCRDL